MLRPSRPWVPLFHRRIWTPMSCGRWVPVVTERHHGLSMSGSERVDDGCRSKSPAGDESEVNRDGRSHSRRRRDSSDFSSSRRPSPPFKRLSADSRCPVHRSCSQDDRWRSPGPRRLRASPSSHASHRSHSPTSHSQCCRSRYCSALSRRPSLAGMTRTLARNASLSPSRHSPSHQARRSPRGRRMSPRTRRMSPNRRSRYSSSRSPTPRRRRSQDLLWWNNVNNQFCQLTTRVSYQRGIRRPFKCTGNHT